MSLNKIAGKVVAIGTAVTGVVLAINYLLNSGNNYLWISCLLFCRNVGWHEFLFMSDDLPRQR